MTLAFRQLLRSLRSGELRVLAASLVLAVAVVTCISVFTSRLENTLIQQSHAFLGADTVIKSSQDIPQQWVSEARAAGLDVAQTVVFSSMVFSNDEMHLAAIKAVTPGYPLIGQLQVSHVPFAASSEVSPAQGIPPKGEVWVDSRLLPLLNIALNDTVMVGDLSLKVTQVLIHEPDRSSNLSVLGARILMNKMDINSTGVIQPGSRIKYQLLLTGESSRIAGYLSSVSPDFSSHQEVVDVGSSQQGLSDTLNTARKFLLIAAVVGVLLGGVAIAIAARHFASLQIDQIALLKSLGASRWKIRSLYLLQLMMLAVLCSFIGLALGEGLQRLIVLSLSSLFSGELLSADWSSYGLGVVSGCICLVFFVFPPLWGLPSVPPIKILRRDVQVPLVKQYRQFAMGLLAIALLVFLFSGDVLLTSSVLIALVSLMLSSAVMALLILHASRWFGRRAGSIWRLGIASLERNRQYSVIQMLVFSLAIMLLLSMTTLRTQVIDEWQMQLPEGTPNHFLVNISPQEKPDIKKELERAKIKDSGFYPMVRARLTHINDLEPSREVKDRAEVLQREVNLSWSEQLPENNQILSGQWWHQWTDIGQFGVSVESDIAQKLGLNLDDELTFSAGGLLLKARVASIRSLQWDSMTPNFYFLFSPGALEKLYPTYLTSVFLSPDQKYLLNDFTRQFPTVLVIEMDRVIDQIQSIIRQVSFAVELVLLLVLFGGVLVMWASVMAGMDERQQETVILRALGSSRKRLLGSLWVEYSVLGAGAGLMAVVGSEILLFSLQTGLLDMKPTIHWLLWPVGVSLGAISIGLMGVFACRKVITVPPGRILRELNR